MYLILNEPYKSKLEHIKLEVRKIEGNSRKSLVPYTPHGVESHIVQLEKLFLKVFDMGWGQTCFCFGLSFKTASIRTGFDFI